MRYKSNATAKKKSVFAVITTILYVIELIIGIGGTIYIAVLDLLPIKYLFILFAMLLFVGGLQYALLACKKGGKNEQAVLKTLCMLLSVVVLFVSVMGVSLLGTVSQAVSTLPGETIENAAAKEDVSKESFVVYLSGVDTRNSKKIPEKGLSDVNMVIAINPNTHKVLMINVPRDYYVPLEGNTNKMDKLTHAGSYGVDCSMRTLEALFDIEFNYYVRINFKSAVDIVDAVGGVTVDSDYAFTSKHSLSKRVYQFKKGENTLSGDAALAFARERKSFSNGDRQRGIHQQMVIRAVAGKLMSPSILNSKKLGRILDAIFDNILTNFTEKEVKSLVKMQLNEMPKWKIASAAVDGRGSKAVTYSGGSRQLYVMIPNQATIQTAQQELKKLLDSETVSQTDAGSSTMNP